MSEPALSPESVARRVVAGVCARIGAPPEEVLARVEELAALYAETTDVRHPMSPLGDTPLVSRDDLRRHFTNTPPGLDRMTARDVRVHATDDPEVVVTELVYDVQAGGSARAVPGVFVMRIRNGQIVESRDYADHFGMAVALGMAPRLVAGLTGTEKG